MQRYTVYLYLETVLHVSGGTSTHHQERCAVGGVRHPQHTQNGSNSSTIPADSSIGVTNTRAVDTVVCAPDDGWKYHPKHVEQFPDINKLCDVASCWIYESTGILLGARPILHISRIKVKTRQRTESALHLSVVKHLHFNLHVGTCYFQRCM
jgi:hypothetical protein